MKGKGEVNKKDIVKEQWMTVENKYGREVKEIIKERKKIFESY